ncbi:MAG: hypothetical protein E7013_03255 [Alphaproteobacteria bacterium]|nr:hypothetical protein [Alphaproteobacteria bacterium]
MNNTDLNEEFKRFREEESRVKRAFLKRQKQEKEFKRKQLLKYGVSYSCISALIVAPALMMTTDMSNASAITYSLISSGFIGFSLGNVKYSIDLFRKNDELAKENLALSLALFLSACFLAGLSNNVLNKTVFRNEPYVIKKQEKRLLEEAKALSVEIDSFASKLPSEKQTEFKAKVQALFNPQNQTSVVAKHKSSFPSLPKSKERTK